MGRRKSKRKPVVKKGPPALDTSFTCPMCHEEKAVVCNLDKKLKQGTVTCRKCGKTHAYAITELSEPVDVYAEWIDELTELKRKLEAEHSGDTRSHAPTRTLSGSLPNDDDDDDEGDDLPQLDD